MIPVSPHAVTWFVSAVLVEAAIIDGRTLKVPNWLTFHLALGGLAFAAWSGGAPAFLTALAGLAVGLALLLPVHAIGGMGAGDVKLLAGVGAWMGPAVTLGAFAASAVVGGVLAVVLIAREGAYIHHFTQLQSIGREILTVRDPVKLSAAAAERKPRMTLLPYAIPLAIGSIGYFAAAGLLF